MLNKTVRNIYRYRKAGYYLFWGFITFTCGFLGSSFIRNSENEDLAYRECAENLSDEKLEDDSKFHRKYDDTYKDLSSYDNKNHQSVLNTVKVQVKGLVGKRGSYLLPYDSNVEDAIDVAGGIQSGLDIDEKILFEKLFEGDIIEVSTDGISLRHRNRSNVSRAVIEKKDSSINSEKNIKNIKKMDLSHVTKTEFMKVSGIGEKLVQRILEYREQKGFLSWKDLKSIPGIGPRKYKKIIDYFKEQ